MPRSKNPPKTQKPRKRPKRAKLPRLPIEMWDKIFHLLNLEEKKNVRLANKHWKNIIDHHSHWNKFIPIIRRKRNKLPAIHSEWIKDLAKGRYKNCKEIRYYPEKFLEVKYVPTLFQPKYYVTLDPREITEGLDHIEERLATMERITTCTCKQNINQYLHYKAIPKYEWKIRFKLKEGTNNLGIGLGINCIDCAKIGEECHNCAQESDKAAREYRKSQDWNTCNFQRLRQRILGQTCPTCIEARGSCVGCLNCILTLEDPEEANITEWKHINRVIRQWNSGTGHQKMIKSIMREENEKTERKLLFKWKWNSGLEVEVGKIGEITPEMEWKWNWRKPQRNHVINVTNAINIINRIQLWL